MYHDVCFFCFFFYQRRHSSRDTASNSGAESPRKNENWSAHLTGEPSDARLQEIDRVVVPAPNKRRNYWFPFPAVRSANFSSTGSTAWFLVARFAKMHARIDPSRSESTGPVR